MFEAQAEALTPQGKTLSDVEHCCGSELTELTMRRAGKLTCAVIPKGLWQISGYNSDQDFDLEVANSVGSCGGRQQGE